MRNYQHTNKTLTANRSGWRLLKESTLLQTCEVCGVEDQFLMSFTTTTKESHQLCSGCYARTIASRHHVLSNRA